MKGLKDLKGMSRVVLAGVVAGALAVSALAQVAAAQRGERMKAQPGAQGHTTPNQQEARAAAPPAPVGELALGTVRLRQSVKADGKPLAAGTYQIRLTAQEARPDVPGQTEALERWVEFLQRGQVKGREVVSIVPQAEIAQVAKDPAPRPNGSKVEMLRGNDYVRVWINRGGHHYLIHLPPA